MNDISQLNDASNLWVKIANLKPRLRHHISVHRQEYRGTIWYVYQDQATNRFHRFDYPAHQFISLMNGDRNIQEIWEALKYRQKDDAPTQDEIIRLLGQLHRIDLLQTNVNPDAEELYQRAEKLKPRRLKTFVRNPISIRLSLFDPEKLLTHTLSTVKPLFTSITFVAWIVLLAISFVLTTSYWEELSSNAIEQALQPGNLLLLGIIYPFVKLLHELGHAYAVKYWGGEVHEIGLIFVLFIPIPYVDASGASAFTQKRQRIIVGAAGIMVELFLACIALLVWLGVEPGLVSTIAFNVMLITGVSTLFFNGNPLLRYDGYYVLSDAIGIPNLSTRSNRYLGYLIQHYLFGINKVESPAHDSGERFWFFFYSPAAFIYRMTILSVIALLVADQVFLIGALLAIWLMYKQIFSPLARHISFVLTHSRTQHNRSRAILASTVMAMVFLVPLFAFPFPSVTVAQGVVWLPDNANIRVGSTGFVKDIFVKQEQQVKKGDVLIQLSNPLQQAHIKTLEARLEDLNAQYKASWSKDRVQSKILTEKISSIQADIKQARAQSDALIIRSPMNGKVIIPALKDLNGQYFDQGMLIAYIVPPENTTARVVIHQDDIGLLSKIKNVHIAFSGNLADTYTASIKRVLPETSHQLPSAALGTTGGGNFAIDPSDKTGLKSVDKVQIIELELGDELRETSYIGKRIFARIDHGYASLAQQWFKSLQQLFLRRFSV